MPNIIKTFNEAIAALNRRDLPRAEELFRRVIKEDKSNVPALNLLVVILMTMQRFAEAEPLIARATSLNQCSDVSFYNYGLISKHLNKHQQALENFSRALALNPDVAETWNNRGTTYNDLSKYDLAISDFDKAISLNNRYSEAYANKGKSLLLLRRPDDALDAYKKALAIKPDLAEAWLGCGNVFSELGRFDEAYNAYGNALAINVDLDNAWLCRANLLWTIGRYKEAVVDYDKALSINPSLTNAWLGRGNSHWTLKCYQKALESYEKALSIEPESGAAWLGRGNVYWSLKLYDKAFAAYRMTLSFDPGSELAWVGQGNLFFDLKQFDEARDAYDKALAIKATSEYAWVGLGNVFFGLTHFQQALSAYDKALSNNPHLEAAWLGRGNALANLRQFDQALVSYEKALRINSELAEVWLGRGNIFAELKKYNEAFVAYDRAWAIKPDLKEVEGWRLHMKMLLCDWENLDEEIAQLKTSIRTGKPNCAPFPFLSMNDSLEDHLRCSQSFMATQHSTIANPPPFVKHSDHAKIRVGYLSADFNTHPVAYLTANLFELHDTTKFETYAFSIGPSDNSHLRQRLEASFHTFSDLNNQSDGDIANAVRASEIDILVDLNGYTRGGRISIIARRPAPIIVNYLGFAGTIGADLHNYIIVDRTVTPRSYQKYFSEKFVYLPHCFMPHDGTERNISSKDFRRSDFGLPEHAFVFCCFNFAYKINPTVFRSWIDIMRNVERSVLWLSDMPVAAKDNLRKEANALSFDPHRLIFAERLADSAEHLARHRLADLFLDTLPYNAHTTASDALWAGLPVLTEIGNTFAGRVAASLLRTLGLSELITCSRDEYKARAIELARDPAKLHSIKKKLEQNRLTSPLFDAAPYASQLEKAYEAMYKRYQAGLAPDIIEVNPGT